jgi:murein DD-endopeptidase MepM/ murein hydrolase activator NlpD
VRATSPGVVTYVGWKGPSGRMVEIDHGLGLRTRYGHLHKILVKRGQKVDFRKKIGLMGTSGRSTGSHVHYEVLFDRKPVDPMKFMKAGKYVFKG